MAVSMISETKTYLTFTLDDEDFAVDVSNVREVLDFTSVTKVPRTPDFMRGVINLRGSVVPVVDMRLKFGMSQTEETVDTCIVVMEVDLDNEMTIIGALANSVREVFEIAPSRIEPPPRIGTRLDTEFILGMGRHDERFIIILDINRIFSADEIVIAQRISEDPPPAGQTSTPPTENGGKEPAEKTEGGRGKGRKPANAAKKGKTDSPAGAAKKAKPVRGRKVGEKNDSQDVLPA